MANMYFSAGLLLNVFYSRLMRPIKSKPVAGYWHDVIASCMVLYEIGDYFRVKFSGLPQCDAEGRSLLIGDRLEI